MSTYHIGAAVVGAGFIGPVHLEALRRLGVHVTGILGCCLEESQRAPKNDGLPRAYKDFEEILSDETVQSVHTYSRPVYVKKKTLPSRSGTAGGA